MAARRGEKHSPSIGRSTLTRAGVAETLGVSVRRVRDLEMSHALSPRVDGKGVHHFSRAEVEAFARRRGGVATTKQPKTDDQAELAAQIFDKLEANVDRVSIVVQLRAHPDIVNDVADKWEKMKARTPAAATLCARGCGAAARFCGECSRSAVAQPSESPPPSRASREDRRPLASLARAR